MFAGQGPKGIAALKNPLPSYRKRISEKSGFKLDAKTLPFEIGYIFIVPEARGRGLSHELVREAIRRAGGGGIFATTRIDNLAMLAALKKAGFELKGKPYRGRSEKCQIQVLVLAGGANKEVANNRGQPPSVNGR